MQSNDSVLNHFSLFCAAKLGILSYLSKFSPLFLHFCQLFVGFSFSAHAFKHKSWRTTGFSFSLCAP
jgi:hypothetical protein